MKRTTSEIELRNWVASKKPVSALAEELGCKPRSLYTAMFVLGIKVVQRHQKISDSDCQSARLMFEKGKSIETVAHAIGASPRGLVLAMGKRGLPRSKLEAAEAAKGVV